MSFIRPEVRAAVWRWRELLIVAGLALVVAALTEWQQAMGGWR